MKIIERRFEMSAFDKIKLGLEEAIAYEKGRTSCKSNETIHYPS